MPVLERYKGSRTNSRQGWVPVRDDIVSQAHTTYPMSTKFLALRFLDQIKQLFQHDNNILRFVPNNKLAKVFF